MALAKRKLGRTGLEVTVLGFGGAPLGDLFARLDDATALATVEAAVQAGITHFDAAPMYGRALPSTGSAPFCAASRSGARLDL